MGKWACVGAPFRWQSTRKWLPAFHVIRNSHDWQCLQCNEKSQKGSAEFAVQLWGQYLQHHMSLAFQKQAQLTQSLWYSSPAPRTKL